MGGPIRTISDQTDLTRTSLTTQTDIQPQDAPLGRLPFTFAKRNGVILTRNEEGEPVILVRPGASHTALAEANRVSGGRAKFSTVEPDRFDQALNAAYQNDSAEAMQMVEGIGDDMDLASLATQFRKRRICWSRRTTLPLSASLTPFLPRRSKPTPRTFTSKPMRNS